MNLLTAEHLKKSYTERLLFDDVAFSIGEGDKIGLIGINGTGNQIHLLEREFLRTGFDNLSSLFYIECLNIIFYRIVGTAK